MLNDGGIRSNRNNKKKNGSDEEEQPILSDAERSGSNKTLDLVRYFRSHTVLLPAFIDPIYHFLAFFKRKKLSSK